VRRPTGSGERLVSCDRETNEHELYVAPVSDCSRLARRATHRTFTLYLGNPISSIETHSAPALTRCYPRSFAFYLGNPISSIETRSAPALTRCYPRSFAFYLGNPISSILTILFILSTKGYPC
jgi:hypothetical protein